MATKTNKPPFKEEYMHKKDIFLAKRILMKNILVLVGLLSLSALSAGEWSYDKHTGAHHWDKLHKDYATCKSGKNQSPINIEHYYHTPDKENLVFDYEDRRPTSVSYDHHTLVAKFAPPSNTILYRDHPYYLINLHFHIPMEFAIHSKREPTSMHLVHQDDEGRLLVVGIGFHIGDANPLFTTLFSSFKNKSAPKILPLETLLPSDIHYYHFNGSLTTPPCTEGVSWFIVEETLSISQKQFEELKRIMHSKPNRRPLQKDYNSVIIKSTTRVRD